MKIQDKNTKSLLARTRARNFLFCCLAATFYVAAAILLRKVLGEA